MIRRVIACLALFVPALALAGLITQSGPRHFSSSGGGDGGEWADTYVTNINQFGAALTNGTSVGFTVGSDFTGAGQHLTSGNGATMDIVAGGAFDGTNAVRIYPPTNCMNGPCGDDSNAEYAAFLRNVDVWNGATRDVKQINMRVLVYYGPRYYDLAPNTKLWGFQVQTVLSTSGGDGNNRIGAFDQREPNYTDWKYPYIIVEGVSTFCNPREGNFIEECPAANKLIEVRGSANHAASPPQTAGEWLCFEHVVDVSQSRGNANGLQRLLIETRDGVVQREVFSALNVNEDWSFSSQYIYIMEGLGFYYNFAGTANPDNYIMFSHPTIAVNMANTDTLIGCDDIPGWRQ